MSRSAPSGSRLADRGAAGLILTALVALILVWGEQALAFGLAVWAILSLVFVIGFGRSARRRRVALPIAGLFLLFSGLTTCAFHYERSAGATDLWLGLPPGTAVLVYGIWPLGLLPTLLYALEFDRSILPEDKLKGFRERHVRER